MNRCIFSIYVCRRLATRRQFAVMKNSFRDQVTSASNHKISDTNSHKVLFNSIISCTNSNNFDPIIWNRFRASTLQLLYKFTPRDISMVIMYFHRADHLDDSLISACITQMEVFKGSSDFKAIMSAYAILQEYDLSEDHKLFLDEIMRISLHSISRDTAIDVLKDVLDKSKLTLECQASIILQISKYTIDSIQPLLNDPDGWNHSNNSVFCTPYIRSKDLDRSNSSISTNKSSNSREEVFPLTLFVETIRQVRRLTQLLNSSVVAADLIEDLSQTHQILLHSILLLNSSSPNHMIAHLKIPYLKICLSEPFLLKQSNLFNAMMDSACFQSKTANGDELVSLLQSFLTVAKLIQPEGNAALYQDLSHAVNTVIYNAGEWIKSKKNAWNIINPQLILKLVTLTSSLYTSECCSRDVGNKMIRLLANVIVHAPKNWEQIEDFESKRWRKDSGVKIFKGFVFALDKCNLSESLETELQEKLTRRLAAGIMEIRHKLTDDEYLTIINCLQRINNLNVEDQHLLAGDKNYNLE